MSDALRSYRIGAVAGVVAGGTLALLAVALRDRWPHGAVLCLATAAAFALCLMLGLGRALEAESIDAPAASPTLPAETSDPRFPITATDPQLATELLLASLTTHPPRPARGPASHADE